MFVAIVTSLSRPPIASLISFVIEPSPVPVIVAIETLFWFMLSLKLLKRLFGSFALVSSAKFNDITEPFMSVICNVLFTLLYVADFTLEPNLSPPTNTVFVIVSNIITPSILSVELLYSFFLILALTLLAIID